MGTDEEASLEHPDLEKFNRDRPYLHQKYDLVFCGGVLATKHSREDYREYCERSRLTLSQLVFAFNRLKSGGSLVLLFHRVESWEAVRMLYIFNMFCDIQVFKPHDIHAIKSSFYLVAKNVNLEHEVAI
jgi:hypothetical protein